MAKTEATKTEKETTSKVSEAREKGFKIAYDKRSGKALILNNQTLVVKQNVSGKEILKMQILKRTFETREKAQNYLDVISEVNGDTVELIG